MVEGVRGRVVSGWFDGGIFEGGICCNIFSGDVYDIIIIAILFFSFISVMWRRYRIVITIHEFMTIEL